MIIDETNQICLIWADMVGCLYVNSSKTGALQVKILSAEFPDNTILTTSNILNSQYKEQEIYRFKLEGITDYFILCDTWDYLFNTKPLLHVIAYDENNEIIDVILNEYSANYISGNGYKILCTYYNNTEMYSDLFKFNFSKGGIIIHNSRIFIRENDTLNKFNHDTTFSSKYISDNYRTKDDLTVDENDELVKKSSLDTILEDFPTIDDVNDTLSTNYAPKSDIPDLSSCTVIEVENKENKITLKASDVDIIFNETTAEVHFKYKLYSSNSDARFSVHFNFNNSMTIYLLHFSIINGIYNGVNETYEYLPDDIEYNVQSLDETNTKYNNSYYLKITITN